jgi:positive regulator of sigma E activity
MNLGNQKQGLGTVTALDGEYAVVLRERFDPCILCPGEDECTETERHECEIEIRALNTIGARVGDSVKLELTDETQILWAILYVYGVPMAFLVGGLLAGVALAQGAGVDPTGQGAAGVVLAVLALGVSVPVSRKLDRRAFESGKFTPVVAEVTTERLEV